MAQQSEKQKVIFVDLVNYSNLLFAVFYKYVFGYKIVYRCGSSYIADSFLAGVVGFLGGEQVNYIETQSGVEAKGFDLNDDLAHKALLKIKQAQVYQLIRIFCKVDNSSEQKIDHSILKSVFSDFFFSGATSITYVDHHFPGANVLFVTKNVTDYCLLKQYKPDLIRPTMFLLVLGEIEKTVVLSITFFVRGVKAVLSGVKNRVKVKGGLDENVPENSVRTDDFKVAYLPHKELFYGTGFSKTYVYSDDENSPLYTGKVLTIFFSSVTDKKTIDYLKKYRINFYVIKFGYAFLVRGVGRFIRGRGRAGLWSRMSLYDIVLLKFLMKVVFYSESLEKYSALRVLYSHYDALTPVEFVLAANKKGIYCISLQERAIQHQFFRNLVFDEYFIYGEGFKSVLDNYGYVVNKYSIIGVPRAYDIIRERDLADLRYLHLMEIKEGRKLVCCVALFPVADERTKLYGSCGVSISSNNDFINDMCGLGREYPDMYFLIRFKMEFDIGLLDSKVLEFVERAENVEIDFAIKELSIYDIVHFSDLVIGKQTSVLEESIAAGKFVIYHDVEGYVASYDYFANETGLVSNSLLRTKELVDEWREGVFDGDRLATYKKKFLQLPASNPYEEIQKNIISHLS